MTTPDDESPNETAPAWVAPDAPAEPPPDAPPAMGPPLTEPPIAGPRRTNRFAVVALVAGLLGMVVFAVGFAIAAFVQAGRRGERGKGLAAGGLAASVVWVAAVAAAVTVGPLPPGSAEPGAREDGKVAVTTLRPGTCFSEFEETPDGMFVRPLPCATPHRGEISGETELPDVPYPGEREASDRAWTACRDLTGFLERSRYGKDLELRVAPPDEDAWKDGKRTARCLMSYTGSGRLQAPLDQTMETKTQYTTELAPGDCVEKWSDNGDQPLIPCTKEHEYEVLASFTMHGDEYPGDKGMEKKVLARCVGFARKAWGARPPSEIADLAYAAPDKGGWEGGNRLAFCLVTGVNGPLKRSVVPH
ncbi:septum formation family protein [Actinomadura sp. GTD37]|uniref:DUF4190 domain-containing protein n=1 Tax=Actinomadura sp. GTD37 TaxID=1778030 RepID=UPI0035C229AE